MYGTSHLEVLAEAEAGFFASLQESLGWGELAEVAGTVLAAIFLAVIFKRFVVTRLRRFAAETDNDVDDRLVDFVSRFYKGIIAFIALIIVLKILNVEITPLLAGAGIFGIGIAYAAKDIIGNFLAGVVMLVDQPIKIGDRIQIERIGSQWGSWGDVVDVGLRTTTVRNTDGVFVTYPNAKLSESIINNFSPSEGHVRFRVRVLIDINADMEKALAVLEQLARDHDAVIDDPAPNAVVRSIYNEDGGSKYQGALLELRCYTLDVRKRTRIRSELLVAIPSSLSEAGIRMYRPKIDLEKEVCE